MAHHLKAIGRLLLGAVTLSVGIVILLKVIARILVSSWKIPLTWVGISIVVLLLLAAAGGGLPAGGPRYSGDPISYQNATYHMLSEESLTKNGQPKRMFQLRIQNRNMSLILFLTAGFLALFLRFGG